MIGFGLLFSVNFFLWFSASSAANSSTSCECGKIGSGEAKRTTSKPLKFMNMNALLPRRRIVNGYEPNRRPFMALIELHKEIPKKGEVPSNSPQCGGAILNQERGIAAAVYCISWLWIVTAAHCFCMAPLKCKRDPSAPDFSLKQVTIFLAQHDITRRRLNRENVYKPSEIVIHPEYIRNEADQNDIALVKVRRKITFNLQRAPICLPPDSMFKDSSRDEVFVAGWGLLNDMECTTDGGGPAPFQRCHFPFSWQDQENTGCAYTYTPSKEDPACAEFANFMKLKGIKFDKEAAGMEVVSKGSGAVEETATCFDESPRTYGWCATCGPKSNCIKMPSSNASKPTYSSNWGWCTKFCNSEDPGVRRTSILQEVQLATLSSKECATYGEAMKALPKIELCAAKKEKKKKMQLYQRLGNEFVLKERANVTDEYIIGGKDSCKGDSGGPLFIVENGTAILIGVVSRGKGCAAENQAGVYTRVKKKLSWILEHISDGNCDRTVAEGEASKEESGTSGSTVAAPAEEEEEEVEGEESTVEGQVVSDEQLEDQLIEKSGN